MYVRNREYLVIAAGFGFLCSIGLKNHAIPDSLYPYIIGMMLLCTIFAFIPLKGNE